MFGRCKLFFGQLVNLAHTSNHTYGCCYAYYKCPCIDGRELELSVKEDPLNPKYTYREHFLGCNIRGNQKCECWKYTIEDPFGVELESMKPGIDRDTLIMKRLIQAYGHLKGFQAHIPQLTKEKV